MNQHRKNHHTAPVNFRTAPSQKVAAARIAEARGVPISDVLRVALSEHVAKARTGMGETADQIVAGTAPFLEEQFEALTRSLGTLNARLDALESKK